MKTMNVFENITRVSPKDCIIDKKLDRIIFLVGRIDKKLDRIIFLVGRGSVGSAIGRSGIHVKKLKTSLGRDIEIIEDDEQPERFIKNALTPATIEKVVVVKRKNKPDLAFVTVRRGERGLAIGKEGRNIERARMLARRHFNIENVIINNQ
ncbi:MAG: NusA-like transcription termination signal-binding factor [Candidatus Heimdallarchaeota archaeon]